MQTILYRTWSTVSRHRSLAYAVALTAIVLAMIGLDKGGCAPPPVYPGG